MRFHLATDENYTQYYHHPLDRKLWKYARDTIKLEPSEINTQFEIAYKIRQFTCNKRVMELGCGEGLLSLILLKRNWAKYVYQVDHYMKNAKDDGDEIYSKFAKDLGVPSRRVFIWAEMKTYRDMSTIIGLDFDIIVTIHSCGILTDIAVEMACAKKCHLIYLPCCYNKIDKDFAKRMYRLAGKNGINCCRIAKLNDVVPNRVMVRVRSIIDTDYRKKNHIKYQSFLFISPRKKTTAFRRWMNFAKIQKKGNVLRTHSVWNRLDMCGRLTKILSIQNT